MIVFVNVILSLKLTKRQKDVAKNLKRNKRSQPERFIWEKSKNIKKKFSKIFLLFHFFWPSTKVLFACLKDISSWPLLCFWRDKARRSKFIFPNFGNFLNMSSGIKHWNKIKKVWERLGKVAPGRVREGDGSLVR